MTSREFYHNMLRKGFNYGDCFVVQRPSAIQVIDKITGKTLWFYSLDDALNHIDKAKER